MAAEIDPYAILELRPDASPQEIDVAWRRAVHAAHPDRNPDDPNAGARLRNIIAAGAILRDPARRAAYDRRRWPPRPQRNSPPTWATLAWDGAGGTATAAPDAVYPGRIVVVHKR